MLLYVCMYHCRYDLLLRNSCQPVPPSSRHTMPFELNRSFLFTGFCRSKTRTNAFYSWPIIGKTNRLKLFLVHISYTTALLIVVYTSWNLYCCIWRSVIPEIDRLELAARPAQYVLRTQLIVTSGDKDNGSIRTNNGV